MGIIHSDTRLEKEESFSFFYVESKRAVIELKECVHDTMWSKLVVNRMLQKRKNHKDAMEKRPLQLPSVHFIKYAVI